MEFKDRIKELRQEKALSVGAFAEKLGKSESAIRMWETGKAKPDADTLITLSEYFNCSTDFLLGISNYRAKDIGKETKSFNKQHNDLIRKLSRISHRKGHTRDVREILLSLNKMVEGFNRFSYDDEAFSLYRSTVIRIANALDALSHYDDFGQSVKKYKLTRNTESHSASLMEELNNTYRRMDNVPFKATNDIIKAANELHDMILRLRERRFAEIDFKENKGEVFYFDPNELKYLEERLESQSNRATKATLAKKKEPKNPTFPWEED